MMANDYYANTTGPQSCSSSRWLTEEVFKLIDMVQHDEAIYNPRHKYYFCRPYVETFWREVDQKLEKNPGASLAKWTNLRISFRREYTNYLEEKVPPCWTYFDRMFFLHPYLRKKHTTPKSLTTQVQDALVRISSLSNRFHRERTTAVAASKAAASAAAAMEAGGSGGVGGSNATNRSDSTPTHLHNHATNQQAIDNYLEYFDDPEQNNSDDLDDVIDDEQQRRRHLSYTHDDEPQHQLHHNRPTEPLSNNDIKSECDDIKSDVDDYEPESVVRQEEVDNELLEEMEMRNFMMDSYGPLEEKRAHLRMQHLMRLQQQRGYQQDEMSSRIKRPRSSQDSISSTQMNTTSCDGGDGACGSGGGVARGGSVSGSGNGGGGAITTNSSGNHYNTHASSSSVASHTRTQHYNSNAVSTAAVHTNVSFVRPTLANKPAVELVSTTTSSSGSLGGLSVGAGAATTSTVNNANSSNINSETDLNATSSTNNNANNAPMAPTSTLLNAHHHHHQRHSISTHTSYNHHSSSSSGTNNSTSNHYHRFDLATAGGGITTGGANNGLNSGLPATSGAGVTSAAAAAAILNSPPIAGNATALAPPPTAHMELCDCKTDPDAMFLMSLLPDIQKLNGRDRGKIKIAFQNILQDYLYPD